MPIVPLYLDIDVLQDYLALAGVFADAAQVSILAERSPWKQRTAQRSVPRERRGPMPIEEGKAAPSFTLSDAGGGKVALKDLSGKHVILYFYPKDDTPGCTKEACGFRDLWKEIQKENAVVLGVSADGAESHQKFASPSLSSPTPDTR
jgi:hypothetical protein